MARTLLFLLSILVIAAAATAHELHLPADIYDHAAGEWSVELVSSCRLPLLGSVTFHNNTAVVEWKEVGAPEMKISGRSATSSLSVAALSDFLTKDSHELSYVMCERQENYLATPQRPVQVAGMTTTYIKAYSGVLSSSSDGSTCDGSSERTIAIQALGAPFTPSKGKAWQMKEALYAIDIVLDTRNVEGTCASKRGAGMSDAALGNDKRSRKRRAHRTLSSGMAVSTADAMTAENGIVTLRFIRRSAAHQPWFIRYYTPIVFATIFIMYRMAHSFSYTRAAKSSPRSESSGGETAGDAGRIALSGCNSNSIDT
ncbi:protein of unknown function - conserved [Leishmania donovani]|uniref:Hypothetical_protein n=1 Tax=Leishmania donovani TaxID=5661 RepID=A0A504XEF9_LEIDO|nr:hypothetical protein CGC20_33310 [Leishmania donovani]CAJ1989871.1 protein of unknown function - conserved [Leishmania donovani]VDZ45734.1 hypothetical_protein [Leishmania donovani]